MVHYHKQKELELIVVKVMEKVINSEQFIPKN